MGDIIFDQVEGEGRYGNDALAVGEPFFDGENGGRAFVPCVPLLLFDAS